MKTNNLLIGFLATYFLIILAVSSLSIRYAEEVHREYVEEIRKEVIAIKNNKSPKKFTIRKHSTPLSQKNGSKTVIIKRNKNGKKDN